MSKVKHKIAVQPRSEFGKNASRRARRAGMVPVNVYAEGKVGQSFFVNAGDWEALSHHELHLVYLDNAGQETAALVKEVQINYLKNHVLHIDFQTVDLNKEIHSEVQLHAIGDCIGASHGGILEQVAHQIIVACKASEIPESIGVDVSKLEVGDAIYLKDVTMPEGVKLVSDPEEIVFHVVLPKQEAEPAPEAAPTEPEAIKEKKDKEEAPAADDKDKAKGKDKK